jgi:phosphotransferase system IIB component
MANVEELRKKVEDLNKKLSGMESFKVSTSTSRQQAMKKTGRGGGRSTPSGAYVDVPVTNVQKNPEYDKTLSELMSAQTELQDAIYGREGTYNTLAEQIRSLGGARGGMGTQVGQPQAVNQAVAALGGDQNFGASDLATRLNFQVSDDQILADYNQSKLNRLNQLVGQGNAQIAGITERLNAAQNLLNSLPSGDPRRTSSEVVVNQLRSDLASVQSGVADATNQIQNFKPLAPGSEEALKQIVSFREYIQLPEERATQQLRQIDPDTFRTAVGLGRQYRQMAMEPLPETTTEPTEQLRQTIEQEALNQLRLGSTIGAEERRGYEQAVRAAQTARGNIFGLGPAVQEAATLGAAGEQRKLARFGAAQQFLASGETTGAAQARDLALRDALTQQRLGAAAGFIAGGPSIANLAQARTAQQQGAFQNFIQATQPIPGQFGQAPSTAQPFFQVAEQAIPVALTGEFNKLYGSQADYAARTYGAQTQAIASTYKSPAQTFADFAGGAGGLIGKIAPGGIFCWVAREVYGEDNPKWLQFREWMLTKASDNLRNYYIEYGERIAKSIRNKPKIKALIRKWMDSKIKNNGAI